MNSTYLFDAIPFLTPVTREEKNDQNQHLYTQREPITCFAGVRNPNRWRSILNKIPTQINDVERFQVIHIPISCHFGQIRILTYTNNAKRLWFCESSLKVDLPASKTSYWKKNAEVSNLSRRKPTFWLNKRSASNSHFSWFKITQTVYANSFLFIAKTYYIRS